MGTVTIVDGTVEVGSGQITDNSVTRDDLNTTTSGAAVVTRIVAGTNVTISETGADTGTGVVTINSSGGGGSVSSVNGETGAVTLDLSEIKAKLTGVADTDYTVLTTDYIVLYSSLSTTRTATLPTAASATNGRVYVIKDGSGSVTSSNKIVIDGNGAETIDGAANIEIVVPYGVARLFTNGTAWFSF